MSDWPDHVFITGQGGFAAGEQRMVEALTGHLWEDLKGADQSQATVFILLFRQLRESDARFTPGNTDPEALRQLWNHAEWVELRAADPEQPNLGNGGISPNSLASVSTGR